MSRRILVALALVLGACGSTDHGPTLARLREAVHAPITTDAQREEHNRLVEQVGDSGALDGLRQSEVEAKIGRGERCETRPLCREHGFGPSDWVYDVGRNASDPELPDGPTLVVGFDTAGICTGTYFVTRR